MPNNKYESDLLIKKLGLNRVTEGLFDRNSTPDQVKAFLEAHPCRLYNIRDKMSPSGQFLYGLTAEQVMSESSQYERYAIFESLSDADDRLVLQGEIQISSNFEMMASLSNIKHISNREAMKSPVWSIISLDLKERREPRIRGLSQIVDYIAKKELLDLVVEFSLFEVPVGINNEKLIIWELRNY